MPFIILVSIFLISTVGLSTAQAAPKLGKCFAEIARAKHSRSGTAALSPDCEERLERGRETIVVALEGTAPIDDRVMLNRNIGFDTTDIFDTTNWCEFITPDETCRGSNDYSSPPKNIRFFRDTRNLEFVFDEGCQVFKDIQIRSCAGQEVGRLYFDMELQDDDTATVTNCVAACWPEDKCACNPLWEAGFLPTP